MTREEVLLDTRSKLQTMGLPKLKSEVGKTFFEMDHVVEALYVALTSGLNIILYGPGGFGKTQVVKKFLEVSGISNSTIVGYEDMEVDGLLGVVDIKKLTEEAVYEIKFEKSVFANPGVLILEEFLDARPSTAAALKDILTEGGYRRGSFFVESLISSVIICTNKSPDELVYTSSSAAFYKERFPISVHVTWKDYSTQQYLKYIQHINPEFASANEEVCLVIAELAHRTSLQSSVVSPRLVKYAIALMVIHGDIKCLTNLNGINTTQIEEVIIFCKSKAETIRVESFARSVKGLLSSIKSQETYSVGFLNDSISKLKYLIERIDSMSKLSVENFQIVAELRQQCNSLLVDLSSKITIKLTEAGKKDIDALFII